MDDINSLIREIDKLTEDAKKVDLILDQTHNIVYEKSKEYVPVDTGELKDSIYKIKSGNERITGTDLDYGVHVNDGTMYQQPNPFFDKAVEVGIKYMEEELSKLWK